MKKYINHFKKYLEKPMVVFDLETNGKFANCAEIVQFGGLRINPDGTTQELKFLCNTENGIPDDAAEIHGITNEDVKDCPLFKDRIKEVAKFMSGCDIGGFNIVKYDLEILKRYLSEAKMMDVIEGAKTFDAMRVYHAQFRRRLEDAVRQYTGETLEGAHDAMEDVIGTFKVMCEQVKMEEEGIASLLEDVSTKEVKDWRESLVYEKDGKQYLAFGKHKDKEMKNVPKDYIQWIVNKSKFQKNAKDYLAKYL